MSGYSGTAKNALLLATTPSLLANGMKFSTKDKDNDKKADGNCAADPARLNGWWYNDCSLSCLNYDTLAQWYRLEKAKDVTQSRMWVKAPGNVTITLCLFVCLCVCLFVMCIKVQGTYTHTKKRYGIRIMTNRITI